MAARILPKKPQWLTANVASGEIFKGVDRENKVLKGYVVAQLGPFKTERGEFDQKALAKITEMINAKPGGLKSRFTHPALSDDGLGKFLGRVKNARMDEALTANGQIVPAVRADLHFDKTAFNIPPSGGRPLGEYVMDLAESDPDALSSSLVLRQNEEYRLDSKGKHLKNPEGNELPPLWDPIALHASDIVDDGDAVDGVLSADLPERLVVERGSELLDKAFGNQPREIIEARCLSFLNKYLDLRHGPKSESLGEKMIKEEDGKFCLYSEDGSKNLGCHDTREEAEAQERAVQANKEKEHMMSVKANTESLENKQLKSEVAELRARLDQKEIEEIFDKALAGKIRSDERDKRIATALCLKRLDPELYEDYIDSLKSRVPVHPDKKEISGHLPSTLTKTSGNNQELFAKYKKQIAEENPKLAKHDVIARAAILAERDPEWVKEEVQ